LRKQWCNILTNFSHKLSDLPVARTSTTADGHEYCVLLTSAFMRISAIKDAKNSVIKDGISV
jgi:hypothetical protein